MNRSLSALKMGDEDVTLTEQHADYKCDECDETFEKPILATIASSGGEEKYYACPRCLSKVEVAKHERKEEKSESFVALENIRKAVAKQEASSGKCSYSLGYLRKHPKDKPFPDECLTCDKMIECMAR